MKVRNFEVERHVGHSYEDDGLEEYSPEMISPLSLEDCKYSYNIRLLRVVGHGVHDGVPDDVLHQLAAPEVLGSVTVGTLNVIISRHWAVSILTSGGICTNI